MLISYIVFQAIPLPLDIVEIVSPYRAERMRMVNLLAATAEQYIPLSETGITGLYRGTFFLGILLYYYCLKRVLLADRLFLRTLVICIVFVGFVEALYGLVQFISPQIGILWLAVKGRAAHGTIIYKNQYASFMNMIWPLAVSCGAVFLVAARDKSVSRKRKVDNLTSSLIFAKNKMHAIFLIFAAGAMWLAVLFSLSRGGILAMVFVALTLTLMLPFSSRKKLVGLSGFILFVCSYGVMLGLDTVISRFNSMGSSGAIRFDIYLSSLPMLMEHWLTGIGMGAYTLLSPVYLKGFPESIHFDRVHNEYLELLIELGIPITLALFGWLTVGCTLVLKKLFAGKAVGIDPSKIVIGIGAFCGLSGFLVHGVVDFGWRLPANLVYATTLLAIVVTCVEKPLVVEEPVKDKEPC
ncbi:hypothetical protein LA52FAK_34060 [Desulforhopalus sp. 52FAK]